MFGNEGDDWIEDGGNAAIIGDNLDDGFARDAIRGNDVMVGVGGMFDELSAKAATTSWSAASAAPSMPACPGSTG